MDEDQPWVNDYLDKMMKDRKFVEDAYNRIQTSKIFEWAETKLRLLKKTSLQKNLQRWWKRISIIITNSEHYSLERLAVFQIANLFFLKFSIPGRPTCH